MEEHPLSNEKTLINDMSRGPVLTKLFRFALPIMLANLLQAVYSMVDMIVVGQFCGPGGLSAVGIGGQLSFLFLTVGMGLGNGGQIVISQQVGMKSGKIAKTVGTMITMEFLAALVIGAIGIVFHNPILDLLNTPPEARSNAVSYLLICSSGMIFIYEYNAICAILRGMGESRLPLVFIAVASLVNIVLDLLFVGVLGWEAAGAAAATVIAQGVAFFIGAVYLYRHRAALGFDFKLRSFRIDREQMIALCRIGIPNVVQQILITGSITFINAQINAFGVTASACDSIGGKLNSVANIVAGSVSTASSTMIAQSFGARNMERVRKAVRACFLINMVWWILLGGCYLLFPRFIFRMFTSDAAVLEMAPLYLRYAVIWLLALCSMNAFYALVNGIGFASFNLIVGLIDGVAARIGLSLLLGSLIGLPGYWLGSGLAGFVTTLSMGFYYLTGWWTKREAVTK